MSQYIPKEKSTLAQVIAWCLQVTRLVSSYGGTGPKSAKMEVQVICEKQMCAFYNWLWSGNDNTRLFWKLTTVSTIDLVTDHHMRHCWLNVLRVCEYKELTRFHEFLTLPSKLQFCEPVLGIQNIATFEVWKWENYFILHYKMDVIIYPCWY